MSIDRRTYLAGQVLSAVIARGHTIANHPHEIVAVADSILKELQETCHHTSMPFLDGRVCAKCGRDM
jgi:hypothetical protein